MRNRIMYVRGMVLVWDQQCCETRVRSRCDGYALTYGVKQRLLGHGY